MPFPSDQDRTEVVDVTCADEADQVTWRYPGRQVVEQFLGIGGESDVFVRGHRLDCVGHESPADPGHRILARGIHVEHPDHVGSREGCPETGRELPGPAVEMGLEDGNQSTATVRAARRVAATSVGWWA